MQDISDPIVAQGGRSVGRMMPRGSGRTSPQMLRAHPRLLIAVTVLGLLLAPALPVDAVQASPDTILTNPARFDGQSVTVSGTITNLRETVSRRGNPYYTLDLSDGKQAIRVFSFGEAPCRSGTAMVEGTFARVKQVGRFTFHNEITATQVTCR